ncbi:sugar phosphate isomerase/epimerase [Mesobacillus maritimus]|uniref:Sugar phosphate isomerase/epimerase n=1 Tax=Mesobacillus maritimus TaxID=1643336 RepID=A0ABS7K8G2_9BACI|nr:sugar phosphate isomerase/epimerase [Mesobacillus maritimus]
MYRGSVRRHSTVENFEKLSLNQITTDQWNLRDAVEGCARAEIPWIAPWRHKVQETGLKESRKLIKDAGLKVSSLCRGGMFPAATALERQKRIDDNKRAVEEAAELGTDVLVLVCGPSPDRDIISAREMVAEGITQLVPFAESYGVKLGIEPLHPMYAAERSVVVSLDLANTLAEAYRPDQVGVVVDVFHVWWDPDLYNQINRAKGRILGFHVSDWLVPLPDMLKGRGMMGDGVIDIQRIRKAVDEVGYSGPIEVEIFNDQVWSQQGDETLQQIKDTYLKHV